MRISVSNEELRPTNAKKKKSKKHKQVKQKQTNTKKEHQQTQTTQKQPKQTATNSKPTCFPPRYPYSLPLSLSPIQNHF